MDNLFRTRALTQAVNEMRPVRTPVLDRVFGRKKGQPTDRFAWDVKFSAERLLPNIRVEAPATVTDKTGMKTITCQAPRFAEKRPISAADLNGMRQFGDQVGAELLSARIADEQFDMRMDVDRTREFMALSAAMGAVVDEAGNILVDYGFADAQKPVLVDGAEWNAQTGDPITDIRAWKRQIANEHAVSGFVAFCGSLAMDALINNQAARELLQYVGGKQIAEDGRITRLSGVDIEEYFGTYKNAAGARTEFFPDDGFLLVGVAPDVAGELYAPVVDLEAPTGVGSGAEAQLFFSKSWEDKDPSARWIKVEARPLPVLYRPTCVVFATVVA